MAIENQKDINKLIKLYFSQPQILYEHLFASYHQFIEEIIPYSLIQEQNYFYENIDKELIYQHGFKCSNIRLKPSVFENTNEIKFPSDSRKNHLNYFATVVADIQQIVEIIDTITGDKIIKNIGDKEIEIPVAGIPIMVKSKYCSTYIKKDLHGECKVDPGGYFIVGGQEKILMSMEKMVDNKIFVFTKKDIGYYKGLIYTAQINSKKNDWADNLQILTIKNRKDDVFTVSTSSQLVDIPLFILMRALGLESDELIISHLTYNLKDIKMLNLIRASASGSVDDEKNMIRTKEEAYEYLMARLRKNKRISQTDEALAKRQKKMYLEKILRQDLLPHLGEDIPKKIMFISFMVNKLLNVMLDRAEVDDRDSLNNKRIEPPGVLLGLLFRQNWKIMLSDIGKHFKKKNQSDESPINVINQIKPSVIEQKIKTSLSTGQWGMNKNKKGVAQSLQRPSWIKALSCLRCILSPAMEDATAKLTSIRHINNNQMQFICLAGDTQIRMSDKTIKNIQDIQDGDNVITINADTLKEESSEIYNKFSLESTELYKLTLQNNTEIKATPEHKLLIYYKKKNWIKTWATVSDIKVGNYLINNNKKLIEIIKKEKINNETVYDFTTRSSNHSFYANDIISSNCGNETPEGAKIGIVKNLSMMSSITMQNASQYLIIKDIVKENNHIKHPYDINPLSLNMWVKIMINGDWIGSCKIKYSQDIYQMFKKKRRDGIIHKHTSILFDYKSKEIRIYYEGGRLIRPLLIVNENKLNLTAKVIKDINEHMLLKNKNESWMQIIEKYSNLIEYEDIESLNYSLVAATQDKLETALNASNNITKINTELEQVNRYGDYRFLKYTHSDFHSWVMMGSTVANIPFANHNYTHRNLLHFCQAKQSIGTYLTSYKDRMDISQILYHPQIPLVTTQAMQYNGTLELPYGENMIVAVASYNGFNQEDSIIFNKTSIERGVFRIDTLKKYSSEIEKNPSTSQNDEFTKPDRNKVTGMKQGNYDKLNENGYAPEETIINNEDVIIGKISPIQPTGNNNKVFKDNSTIFKSNVQGVIDRVHTDIYNNDGYEMYNIRVRMERPPIAGDKFTNYHGQKGTIGITYKQKDMPFTESGLVPDLIINPHGYPSRMSLGNFIECLAGRVACETGKHIDGTPFSDFDVAKLPEKLKELGLSEYGTETMYCGITGRKMDYQIFIGPVFTIRLKHMVLDKVHGRARGPKQSLTRQPLEGRSRDGGLRVGEMEQQSIVAHGMGQFLKERFMETSDICKVHVCDDCGMFASKANGKEYYKCNGCKNTTRISAVVIPYASKLLFQELTAVNILPRIKTERSIYADEL